MDDERTLGQTSCDEYFLSDSKGCPLKIWDCCPMESGVTFDELKEKIQVSAKTRYSTKESKAIIYPIENGKMKVEFIEPQRAITPGQSIVFYDGDIVLGGGKIEI